MMQETQFFQNEVTEALHAARSGKVLLYPTDTIWGLGCDATNPSAIRRIYELKNREDTKSLIILVAEEKDILNYVAAPDPAVFEFLAKQERPTTIIFEQALALPDNLVASDGSIAIRIVRDEFCRHLIKRLQKPLVSTSANISGEPSPQNFDAVSEAIRKGVDHIVKWRQDDHTPSQPSHIIKWYNDGRKEVIR
ncbi:MAG TPA: L-threonylcarbamoyladenylate synthase [Flavisolibacter sp.]|nr:L-threonylcarbamoyladenylate synthase [Flavisolibacter sp.]